MKALCSTHAVFTFLVMAPGPQLKTPIWFTLEIKRFQHDLESQWEDGDKCISSVAGKPPEKELPLSLQN